MTKSYAEGPIDDQNRKCTDVFCLVAFVLMSLLMFIICIYSWFQKGITNMITPSDSDGKKCGIDYPNQPYIYFVSPHVDSLNYKTCVTQCPQANTQTINCKTNSLVTSCNAHNSSDHTKAFQLYNTSLFLSRICMPQVRKIRQQILQSLKISISEQKITQLNNNYQLILLAIPASVVITMLVMLLVRFTACCSTYFIIITSILIFFILAYLCFRISLSTQAYYLNIDGKILLKIAAGVFVILALIILVSFCCFKNRINIAIKIIKASARFVNQNCALLLIPFFKILFTLIFIALWIIELVGLYLFKDILFEKYKIQQSDTLSKIITYGILILHSFYFLWGFFFITQSGTFIVSGTVTNWYFDKGSPCTTSMRRYATYHSGSVSTSSFFIALFGFFKIIYEIFKPNSQQQNSLTGKIQKCCDCLCCLCVNCVFNLLNRGAYAFIHLAGRPYCESSLKILGLRTQQLVLSGVMAFLQIVYSLIIRIQIIAITVGIAYAILKLVQPFKSEASDKSISLILIGIIALIISQLFVSIYIQAADTVTVCFIIDKEYGTDDTHCPQELKNYLQQTKQNDGIIQ